MCIIIVKKIIFKPRNYIGGICLRHVGYNYYNLLDSNTYSQNNYNTMIKIGNIRDNIGNESYFKDH